MAGILDKIKTSIFGMKVDNSADENIDKTLYSISQKLLNKDSLNSVDLVRDLISKSNLALSNANISSDFFQGITSSTLLLHDNKDRIYRYINAEEICDAIPYCAKALKVLTDQIISPDDITKKIIQIFGFDANEEENDDIKFIREINEQLNLDDSMYEIVYDTLKFGDQFIEICDIESSEVPITQTILTEDGSDIFEEDEEFTVNVPTVVLNENGEPEITNIEKHINLELVIEDDSNKKELSLDKLSDKDKKNGIDLSNLRLIIHDPAYVIKIQSNRFKLCLGYLVIPKTDPSNSPMNLLTGSGNIGAQILKQTNLYYNYTGTNNDFFSGVNQIYKQIIDKLKKHLLSKDENKIRDKEDISINKNEALNILSRAIKDIDENSKSFRVRYVPPERMEHFEIYNKRFFPYGESILYKSTFQGKLLIALETALTVKRLSDSTEKRIIYVESGAISRNVKNTIEILKEGFKKRKYSLDSFGSIGSIPSYINTYEDYYIPQRNGKRYVEFDTLSPPINIRDISEELKFFRDQLVASLDVPPSFVSLEENSVTKANLAQESNVFARTIISYQALFGKCIQRLFSKIYRFCRKEKMPDVRISLSPPKLLQSEIYADFLDIVMRIANSYNELGIPKEHVVKELLSLEWEKIEHSKVEKALEDRLKSSKEGSEYGGTQF